MNPEITEDMVEAAAKAAYDYNLQPDSPYCDEDGEIVQERSWQQCIDDGQTVVRMMRGEARAALEAAAPLLWQQGFEAGQRSADGDEFVFSSLLGQVGVLLMGDAESMLLWHKDGMFTCTFNTLNFDDRSQHPLIEAAIAGAVIQAEGEALERRARASAERAKGGQ